MKGDVHELDPQSMIDGLQNELRIPYAKLCEKLFGELARGCSRAPAQIIVRGEER